MTMQERGKDEDVAPPNADLSADRADQLAADFTPAWGESSDEDDLTTQDALADKTALMNTIVDAVPPVEVPVAPIVAAVVAAPEPVPFKNTKNQTMIGAAVAPIVPVPVPAESVREMIEPEPAPIPPPAPRSIKPAPIATAKDPFAPPASLKPVRSTARMPNRPVSASDEADAHEMRATPKKSGKGMLFAVLGLAIAAGLGIFLKFALTDDAPKEKEPMQQASTPPVTPPNADIPPPPPAEEPVVTAAAKKPPPPPPVEETRPTAKNDPPPVVREVPRDPAPVRPRHNNPTPPVVVAPPPAVKNDPPPKPTKPAGGIVHENPF